MTIYAGVHVVAVSMLGMAQHRKVGLSDIQDLQGNPQPLSRPLGPLGAEKGGDKGNTDHIYPLFEEELCRQDAVKTPRDKPQRPGH